MRARNIKPGFFLNEDLAELDFCARLLFIGLWVLADREGRIEDRPRRIKRELFPSDNMDVDDALNNLAEFGFLERYSVNDVSVIQIIKFSDHQSPHGKEKDSELPDKNGSYTVHDRASNGLVTGKPSKIEAKNKESTVQAQCNNETVTGKARDKHSASTRQARDKHETSTVQERPDSLNPDSLNPDSLNPDSLNPDSEESQPEPTEKKPSRATRFVAESPPPENWISFCKAERPDLPPAAVYAKFADFWIAKPGKDGVKLDWMATWRNWVRSEGAWRSPPARATTPSSHNGFDSRDYSAGIDPVTGSF